MQESNKVMITMRFQRGYGATIIDINVDHENTLLHRDIDKMKTMLKYNDPDVSIICSRSVTIRDPIFQPSTEKLYLRNVILSREVIQSLPKSLRYFTVNHDHPYLDELNVQRLVISPFCDNYNVPATVKELEIDGRDMVINCHDQLEKFTLSSKNAVVTLTNCNNLKHLHIAHVTSRVCGEFLDYISDFTLSYTIRTKMYSESVIYLCEYLSMFKNLQSYEGYIERDILKALGSIRKVTYHKPVHVDIDDIPDSLEDMNFMIDGTNSSDILDKKPNIKRIRYSERKLTPDDVISRYPDVHFYIDDAMIRVIVRNNKKLSRLLDLC